MKETQTHQVAPSRLGDPETASDKLIDAHTLLATCGGNAGLLRQLVQSFENHIFSVLDSLNDAIRHQDRPATQQAAHRLRGLVSSFSTVVAEVALSMELPDYSFDRLGSLYDAANSMVNQLLPRLHALMIADLMNANSEPNQVRSSLRGE